MIISNCFEKFTEQDYNFIRKVTYPNDKDNLFFNKIYKNELANILDKNIIFDSVINGSSLINISMPFYFYLIARRIIKPIDSNTETSQYFANFLDFYSKKRIQKFYLSDYLSNLDQFYVSEYIANEILFLLSIVRYGLDNPNYYEQVSQQSFRKLCEAKEASYLNLSNIYSSISENYKPIKYALQYASESIIFL